MANVEYHPDPYNGWSVLNHASNVTAYELMNDTSGRWQRVADYGTVRVYASVR